MRILRVLIRNAKDLRSVDRYSIMEDTDLIGHCGHILQLDINSFPFFQFNSLSFLFRSLIYYYTSTTGTYHGVKLGMQTKACFKRRAFSSISEQKLLWHEDSSMLEF